MRENDKLTPRAKDQVLGCMVGGAVGDALGYAVEFESYGGIVKKYGEQGITHWTGMASQRFPTTPRCPFSPQPESCWE